VEPAFYYYFTPAKVTVPQCKQHASLVKFNYNDDDDDEGNPHSFAITALKNVTAGEMPPGSSTRVNFLVASQVWTLPFCSPLTAEQVQSEVHINCILTARPP
jgi:hypothetical protein